MDSPSARRASSSALVKSVMERKWRK
jgi:hypothetical protein